MALPLEVEAIRHIAPQPLPEHSPERNQTVNKIRTYTLRVFIELGTSIALNCGVMWFFAAPFTINALTVIAITSIIGVAAKIFFEINFGHNDEDPDALMPVIGEMVSRTNLVNTAGLIYPNIWIHEAGHAVAAALCFKKPDIIMMVKPFTHGDTSFVTSNGLTTIGSYFGKYNAITLYRAGGLIGSTVFAMTEIAVAFFFKDKSPQVSLTLNCHAFSQIANDVLAGIAALISRGFNVRNDYLALWKIGGIHPVISMTLMVALPIILYCGLRQLSPS